MTTYTLTHLAGPTQLTTSAATLYTASGKVQVKSITIANTGAATTFTLSRGTDAVATRLFAAIPIGVNETVIIRPDWTLENTNFIQGFAGAATQVNVEIDGVVIT